MSTQSDTSKPYVVFVPQLIVGGHKPFFFKMKWAAEAFADETGGTLYARN